MLICYKMYIILCPLTINKYNLMINIEKVKEYYQIDNISNLKL